MSDYRISYANESDLLTYARSIGWTRVDENGVETIVTSGMLPDGSGAFFMTGPMRLEGDNVNWWRTLRINGDNPFGPGGLPLPTVGVTVWPPGDTQPVVAVIS